MNRTQLIAITATALNLALVMCFPPYDYLALARGNVATFDGFYFVLAAHPNRIINTNFFTLESIVVLINGCIAWLLLRDQPTVTIRRGIGNRYQRGVLWLVALNLVLMLLFPPFENYKAITRAALPSFEGFYFIFADNSQRQLVATILYIEIALALINGGLLWMLFKDRGQQQMSAAEIRNLAERVRKVQHS